MASDHRVRAAAVAAVRPFRAREGRVWLPDDAREIRRYAGISRVGRDYFDASNQRILQGRSFSLQDERLANVAVVDLAFVRRFRLEEPIVGRTLRVHLADTPALRSLGADFGGNPPQTVTIVGVAENAVTRPMSDGPQPSIYIPLAEVPTYAVLYLSAPDAGALIPDVRKILADLDPDLPPVSMSTVEAIYLDDPLPVRLMASAAQGLGSAALFLALAGLYSVVAFFVSLRTREFGIRIAIGARPKDVTRMMLRQAARLVGSGIAVGAVLSVPLLVFLTKEFPHTSALDAIVAGPTILLLAATALIAAWIPARRAAAVDPAVALRAD